MPRSPKRYAHLPGHIRDAFHAAVEAFGEWDDGEPVPFVDFEVDGRGRRISLAQACGLVWGCTDMLENLDVAELEMCGIKHTGVRTYAGAARSLLNHLRETPGGVNSARDAQIERLFNRRDRHAERLEIMLGVRDLGKPPDDCERVERMQIRIAAERLIEQWRAAPDGSARGGVEDDAITRELAAITKLNQQIGAAQPG
jgi:hypothetical protein